MTSDGVLIFGATGSAGEELVRKLRQENRAVYVMSRSDKGRDTFEALGVNILKGDAFSKNDVLSVTQQASEACSTVVTYLGGWPMNDPETWPDYIGNKNVIDAAREVGIRRVILVTSIGCGKSWDYIPETTNKINAGIMKLKTQAEEYLRKTNLDWTIVRPGGLGKVGSVPTTGEGILTENEAVRGSIARDDLADLTMQVIGPKGDRSTGKTLAAVATKIQVFEGELSPFQFA